MPHEMSDKKDQFVIADDWTGNWQANVAIKITSIVIWIVVVFCFGFSVIYIKLETDKLNTFVDLTADHIAYSLTQQLQEATRFENQWESLILTRYFTAAKLTLNNQEYNYGTLKKDDDVIVRDFVVPQENGQIIDAKLYLYHVPQKKLIRTVQIMTLAFIGVMIFIFAITIVLVGSKILSKPFKAIEEAIQLVRKGDLSIRMETHRHDEFGRIAHFFNDMLDVIQQDKLKIEESNKNLEFIVQQRTLALEQVNNDLLGTLTYLKQTQKQLVLSEKMAVLGQIVAGVTHEINTPLGAIRASIGNMAFSVSESIKRIPELFLYLNQEKTQLFLSLLSSANQSSIQLTSRERRQLRRKISHQLSASFLLADEIADVLVDIGVVENYALFYPLFEDEKALMILRTASHLVLIQDNCSNISEAVERTSKVVLALRKYSYHDDSDQFVKADVNDNIEIVLTLYHNNLKQGIDVIRQFAEIPEIDCYPDELSQVWTNIIHNAIHAMKNQGKLIIATKLKLNHVVVSFTDGGPGICESHIKRIFDPFFTTKVQGEGSGLGLDICNKIIKRHNGRIAVKSCVGKTRFTIVLPVLQDEVLEIGELNG